MLFMLFPLTCVVYNGVYNGVQDFGLSGKSNTHLIDNMEKVRRKIELVESLLEASCPSPRTAFLIVL